MKKTLRAALGAVTALCAAMTVNAVAQQTGGLPALREELTAEAAARMAADQALGGSVAAEAAARQAADQALSDSLALEAAARMAADKALSDNVAWEAAARQAADQAMNTMIHDEIAARIAGDAALANKGCGSGLVLSGFDAQGAPICSCPVVDVRNYVESPADFWWVRSALIQGGFMNYAKVAPGAPVQLSFEYMHTTIPDCPYCLVEFVVGFSHLAPDPANCVPPFTTPEGPTQATKIVQLTAPAEPGFYTISVSRTLEYYCHAAWTWATFPVAAVCVQ